VNPLGGHIGSDGDGLGPKQPELFDIHVMIFAGDPQSTVEGLARFFSIDREAAERLVEDVPIIVKRSAEPDVAAEMVDVLGGLGAQVVLLPAASAISAETDLLELKVPSVMPGPPARGASAEWGALETAPRPRRAEPRAEPSLHADSSPRAEPKGRAATVDLIAAAPMAELDLSPPAQSPALEARAPARSGPPERRGVIDDELVIAPLYDPTEVASRAHGASSAAASVSLPPAVGESIPPALGGPSSHRPPTPLGPDLGLGSVPPLPQLGAVPPVPPPVPGSAPRGAPRVPPPSPKPLRPAARPQPPPAPGVVPGASQQRSHYERTLDTDVAGKLPSLGVLPTSTETKAAARPLGGDNYWSGRRAAGAGPATPELGEVDGPVAQRPASDVELAGGAPGEAIRGVPARPTARAASKDPKTVHTRSAGRALLQIVGGALVFGLFLQQGNSILLGNADLVSTVLHAFALFTIGLGLAELKP
jgi:hypothetical protein